MAHHAAISEISTAHLKPGHGEVDVISKTSAATVQYYGNALQALLNWMMAGQALGAGLIETPGYIRMSLPMYHTPDQSTSGFTLQNRD